jgi:hypothetical protein
LESIMCILNFQRWKLPPSNLSTTFKDSIWKNDTMFNTNAKTNILCLSTRMKLQVGELQYENLLMFENLISNLSHSIVICQKTKP